MRSVEGSRKGLLTPRGSDGESRAGRVNLRSILRVHEVDRVAITDVERHVCYWSGSRAHEFSSPFDVTWEPNNIPVNV